MQIRALRLRNWRNFRAVVVPLTQRAFVVGPNASGKSNLLEALRFLRDVAIEGGGFQAAVRDRQGVSKIRSLHARGSGSEVLLGVDVEIDGATWTYELEFTQDAQRKALIRRERVLVGSDELLSRPDENDIEDPSRLSQTHLEQVNANRSFRRLAEALASIRYLHLVPQFLRDTRNGAEHAGDPYGRDFLERLALLERANKRVFSARMRRLNEALQVAVPQLSGLTVVRDSRGVPHLEAVFQHWRPNAGQQTEEQFSDGTLRLIGLLWSILDGDAPLLLEEPELSLHPALVRRLPALLSGAAARAQRQLIISTHSSELLSDPSIAPDDVLLLQPTKDGTVVLPASKKTEITALVDAGVSLGEAALPVVAPTRLDQLFLRFDD